MKMLLFIKKAKVESSTTVKINELNFPYIFQARILDLNNSVYCHMFRLQHERNIPFMIIVFCLHQAGKGVCQIGFETK